MTDDHLRNALWPEALALTRDRHDAEDLVQECLAVLLTHRSSIRDPGLQLAWCRVVLRNLFRQQLRRRWWETVLPIDELPPVPHDPWSAVDAGLSVAASLQELPAPQRESLRSFYLGGRSIKETAVALGRPEGTIKRWLHEGRESMRMKLGAHAKGRTLARIYASDWEESVSSIVFGAVSEAGFTPSISSVPRSGVLPNDAGLFVFGERVGCRSGLELLLAVRASEGIANTPVVLFGSARKTAILAAWQAQADIYLTDPACPELAGLLIRLWAANASGATGP